LTFLKIKKNKKKFSLRGGISGLGFSEMPSGNSPIRLFPDQRPPDYRTIVRCQVKKKPSLSWDFSGEVNFFLN